MEQWIVNHASFFTPKRRSMSDNIQTNTTGRLTPCLQKKIDKTTYLVEVHFSATSTQSVEEKLKRVILHDLQHGKQGRPRKSDEKWWICPWQAATGPVAFIAGGGCDGVFAAAILDSRVIRQRSRGFRDRVLIDYSTPQRGKAMKTSVWRWLRGWEGVY